MKEMPGFDMESSQSPEHAAESLPEVFEIEMGGAKMDIRRDWLENAVALHYEEDAKNPDNSDPKVLRYLQIFPVVNHIANTLELPDRNKLFDLPIWNSIKAAVYKKVDEIERNRAQMQ